LIVFRIITFFIFLIIKLFFMKFKLSFFLFILFVSVGVSAQQVTKTFPVSGNCGMCKKKIEAAATKQGATSASWDKASQSLSVSFDAGTVSEGSIKQAIADAGYDADGVKASETVYESLPDCCKYRVAKSSASSSKSACCVKDGVCKGDKKCCKKNGGDKSCCASATCEKENGCCSKCEKGSGKQCCAADHKDKACDKKGGKDCCKKKDGCKSEEGCKH
jgi:mercuric ion binding protein